MEMERDYRNFIVLNIVFPLIIGFLIYLLFRDENLIIYRWFESIGVLNVLLPNNSDLSELTIAVYIPSWAKYSLSDGIWMYVFTSTIFVIWVHKINLYWIVLPFILGIGYEISQLFEYIPGTFDYTDLIFLVSAYLLALGTGYKWRTKCIKT